MSMEKNRIRPIKSGKSFRMSYSRQKEVLEMPNLIEIQVDSYKWFLESGLKEVFDDISPITDYSGKLSLEFVDFTLCEDDVKYSIEECKERDGRHGGGEDVGHRLRQKDRERLVREEVRQNEDQGDQQNQLPQTGHDETDLRLPQRHKRQLTADLKAHGKRPRKENPNRPGRVIHKRPVAGKDASEHPGKEKYQQPEHGGVPHAHKELAEKGFLHPL